MSVSGYDSQYWAERTSSSRRRSYPSFKGQHTADAVVIGGGLTGSTAAYVLAHAGLKVVLLEAGRMASGSTAGSLGAMVPQPDAEFRAVEKTCGVRVARNAWNLSRLSALEFAAALRKLSIKCDLTPAPVVIEALTQDDALGLRREQAVRKAAGVDAPWLNAVATASATGQETSGAVRLRDGFTFDPVRAALGLAAAAESKGAQIFEKSLVKRTRFTRKYADVILASGSIRTKGIFVATGEPGALFGQLRRHVTVEDGHAVVTEPLSAAMRREAGPRTAIITEAGATPHWLRWLAEDRALFTGALSKPVGTRLREKALVHRTAQLMYELSVRYPVISGLPAKWAWRIPVVSTADRLPWIGVHRNYPFHFFAMAFGWHGDGLAWFAAKAALRQFTGEATREDETFGFLRSL